MVVPAPERSPGRLEEVEAGLRVIPVPTSRPLFAIQALPPLFRLLSDESFDLITTQTPFDDGLVGTLLSRRFKLPLHVQMNSSFLDHRLWLRLRFHHQIFNLIGKGVSRHATTVRVVCSAERHRLESLFPELKGKVTSLHPFVRRCPVAVPVVSHSFNRALQWLEDSRLFLYVGRLAPEKNLSLLLRAFQRLPDQVGKLILVGDGVMKKKLERESRGLGISRKAYWAGSQPFLDLQSWYSRAHVTILPSLFEGFGKVIVESYLQQTPVVVTPFMSATELVEPDRTGYILRSFKDPDELAGVLENVSKDPSVAFQMGKLGKRKMNDYLLSEEEYMGRLISIWEDTINRHTALC